MKKLATCFGVAFLALALLGFLAGEGLAMGKKDKEPGRTEEGKGQQSGTQSDRGSVRAPEQSRGTESAGRSGTGTTPQRSPGQTSGTQGGSPTGSGGATR